MFCAGEFFLKWTVFTAFLYDGSVYRVSKKCEDLGRSRGRVPLNQQATHRVPVSGRLLGAVLPTPPPTLITGHSVAEGDRARILQAVTAATSDDYPHGQADTVTPLAPYLSFCFVCFLQTAVK